VICLKKGVAYVPVMVEGKLSLMLLLASSCSKRHCLCVVGGTAMRLPKPVGTQLRGSDRRPDYR
jgi:hypothetical protein